MLRGLFPVRMLCEGEVLPPWYYGIAYVNPVTNHAVFYPIPFNFVGRWWRILAHRWNDWRGSPPNCPLLTHEELRRLTKAAYERGREEERVLRYLSRISEVTHANGN
jgi:hypothetical protein